MWLGLVAALALLAGVATLALTRSDDGPSSLAPAPRPTALAVPAAEGARAYQITEGADDRLYLSWIESGPESAVLRYSVFEDGAWSSAATVSEGSDWFVNWADRPRVFGLPGGGAFAHWLVMREDETPATYSYGLRVARSDGVGWRTIHDPLADTMRPDEYTGFLSFLHHEGEILAAYLAPTVESGAAPSANTHGGEVEHPMDVRLATFTPEGSVTSDVVLDVGACTCCPLSMATTSRGPVVVYRDRSAEEVRDIAIVRRVDGQWTEAVRVHDDGWVMPGCPVNGPSVVADGDQVFVAWVTGAEGELEVRGAWSDDAGESFAAPVRIDAGGAFGYTEVVWSGEDRVGVSWLEQGEGRETPAVLYRTIGRDGELGPVVEVGVASGGRAAGMPEMGRAGDGIVFAWRDGETLRSAIIEDGR